MPMHALITNSLKKQHLIKYFVLGMFLCVGCTALEKTENVPKTDKPPQLSLRAWETVVVKNGQQRVRVRADSLVRETAQGDAHFSGHIRVVFLGGGGDTASVLTALRGGVDSEGHKIVVSGQVVVLAGDSTRLETDSLRWDRKSERIFGDGSVTIFRPEGKEQGVGFEASADLKQWTLKEVQTQVTGAGK